MQAGLHLVDAFTSSAFRGNTAGVCIPDGPADTAWMQQVAAKLKHSETAFLFPEGANWNLRWFTPGKEVELCGHATLAAASVLWETGGAFSIIPGGSTPVIWQRRWACTRPRCWNTSIKQRNG
ncbi:MAG: PhzF family phenazine biosynthesis isomerase [Methanoregula sp.]